MGHGALHETPVPAVVALRMRAVPLPRFDALPPDAEVTTLLPPLLLLTFEETLGAGFFSTLAVRATSAWSDAMSVA